MIVAANSTFPGMSSHQDTLFRMTQDLAACQQGTLPVARLSSAWRDAASTLPLPARFGEVLGQLLDRLEAGALFSEESCSFSQKDLLSHLEVWAEKARTQL